MHDPCSAMWGTFVLWLGWFGFTAGSSLAFSGADGVAAVHTAANTALAGVHGLVAGLVFSHFANKGHIRVEAISTALLSALVAITPGCAFVQPWEAALIGFTGALAGMGASRILDRYAERMQLDDPVQAIGIHLGAGVWGMICTGLFNNADYCLGSEHMTGLFHGGSGRLLGVQILGCVSFMAWSATMALLLLCAMQYLPPFRGVRITPEEEEIGLDVTEHGIMHHNRRMWDAVSCVVPVLVWGDVTRN